MNSKMWQVNAERDDNLISDSDYCLLLEEYKLDEILAENEKEKFEQQETKTIAKRCSKAKYNYKLKIRR